MILELATLLFAAASDGTGQGPSAQERLDAIDQARKTYDIPPMTEEEKLAFLLEEKSRSPYFVALVTSNGIDLERALFRLVLAGDSPTWTAEVHRKDVAIPRIRLGTEEIDIVGSVQKLSDALWLPALLRRGLWKGEILKEDDLVLLGVES